MALVASGILCLGMCMVLVTPIFAAISAGNVRLARRLRRTPPTPIGTWSGRNGFVTVEAVVEHGTAGPQIGPLSGEACAWYEMTLTLVRRSSEAGNHYSEAGTTPAPPVLTDGTGSVTIHQRLLTDRWGSPQSYQAPSVCDETSESYHRGDERPSWVTEGMAKSLGIGESLLMTEVRLPRGREVFAMGRVAGGVLRPGRGARIIKGTWAGLITETEDDLSLMAKAIPVFVVVGSIVGVGGFGLLLLVTG
ncbi:hypothetical protein [Paractinoplanes toevensis]|nr:hypothetical protein [Actinoplanes toevensis]